MMRRKLKHFQELSPIEIIEVAKWRNDYRTRKFMKNRHVFSLNSHKRFIASLDFDYIKVNDIGCFNIIQRTDNSIELGIFKNPVKKGVGKVLLKSALEYIEQNYSQTTIVLEVYRFNRRAIKLYKQFGFRITKQTNKIYYMELKSENRKIRYKR